MVQTIYATHADDDIYRDSKFEIGHRPTDRQLADALLHRAGIIPSAAIRGDIGQRLIGASTVEIVREAVLNRRILVGRDVGALVQRSLSSGAAEAIFSTALNAAVLTGYAEARDTTEGWTTDVSLPNFKPNQVLVLQSGESLEPLARGAAARHATIQITASTWRLARYARQLVCAEEDLVDANPEGGLGITDTLQAAKQLGSAARRLRTDLVWSAIMANGAIESDDVALFHASHANFAEAGSALTAASLATAVAAIGNQTAVDGDGHQVHLGLEPAFLITPPDLSVTAKGILNGLRTGKDDLEHRAESRIGTAGLTDPTTGETRTGSATNWHLVAKPTIPTVILGSLDGQMLPRVSQSVLKEGQWGLRWQIEYDLACVIADWKTLYLASGAGE